jgi:hypothetical protein
VAGAQNQQAFEQFLGRDAVLRRHVFSVPQTSKSAVSQVSKPADRRQTWKSAARQVWKPALQNIGRQALNSYLRRPVGAARRPYQKLIGAPVAALSWITLDYLGLPWITLDYLGLSWITLDYPGFPAPKHALAGFRFQVSAFSLSRRPPFPKCKISKNKSHLGFQASRPQPSFSTLSCSDVNAGRIIQIF